MELSEAVKILENGGRIRQKNWKNDEYLYVGAFGVINHSTKRNEWTLCKADNWEEYAPEVKISSLKVGDKWKYKGGILEFLILPQQMGNYIKDFCPTADIVCQDLNSSFVDLCSAHKDELVVQIKD